MPRFLIALLAVVMAVGSVGVDRVGLGTSAQEGGDALAGHPLTGTWLAMTQEGAAAEAFAADGSVTLVFPPTQVEGQGVEFPTASIGTWESTGARSGHFTAVQVLSTADGAFIGTVTIDGYPTVSADGQTFVDDGSQATVTIRDAANTVVMILGGDGSFPPVTATRLDMGSPGFRAATPTG